MRAQTACPHGGSFRGCSRRADRSLDDHDDLVVAGSTVGDWFGAVGGLDCAVVASMARTLSECRPGVASQRYTHCRHVSVVG